MKPDIENKPTRFYVCTNFGCVGMRDCCSISNSVSLRNIAFLVDALHPCLKQPWRRKRRKREEGRLQRDVSHISEVLRATFQSFVAIRWSKIWIAHNIFICTNTQQAGHDSCQSVIVLNMSSGGECFSGVFSSMWRQRDFALQGIV